MNIQWFPGHMNKARKALEELVREIDIVIELLDARAPFSSCNPLLQSIIKHKHIIRLLNKSDLANIEQTQIWLSYFNQQTNTKALASNKFAKNQKTNLIALCKKLLPNRNSYEKPLRVMVTGIPNVGKSTLINLLLGKKAAKTGDVPAVTKANQQLYLNDSFIIYDTPGMMWPKIQYPQIGYNLALCNCISRNAIDEELLTIYLLEFLVNSSYHNNLINRYNLKPEDLKLESQELLKLIASKRGCLLTRGKIDVQKISEIIIQDFRDSKLGLITLETPNLWEEWLITPNENMEENVEGRLQ